jgi:hypothetical protein
VCSKICVLSALCNVHLAAHCAEGIEDSFPNGGYINILLNKLEKKRKYEKVGNMKFHCQIFVVTKEITQ